MPCCGLPSMSYETTPVPELLQRVADLAFFMKDWVGPITLAEETEAFLKYAERHDQLRQFAAQCRGHILDSHTQRPRFK